jgi:hypothetical protein
VRTADPRGGPPWGIRVYRSSRGYYCAQYGRVVDGRLVRIGRDGQAHELALHCLGDSAPGSFGYTGRLYFGYPGRRARRVIITPPGRTLPVRDGAYLGVFAHPLRTRPRITVVGGVEVSPPRPPPPPRVEQQPIRTSARTIGPDGAVLVTFRAPLAIRDARTFYRAEANGPHGETCAGRLLAATNRNYAPGDLVHLRLIRQTDRPWCRGSFRGRVSISGSRTVGRFALIVR